MKKVKSITIGYSVLSEYKKCPEKFKLRYAEGITKKSHGTVYWGSPLLFGQFLHLFMELYYSGQFPAEQAIHETLLKAGQSDLSQVAPEKQRSLYHLEQILYAYIHRYGTNHTSTWAPAIVDGKSGIELEVDIPLMPGVTWRQHYDGLVIANIDMPDFGVTKGQYLILEHKTSSGDMRTSLLPRMDPNDQVEGYTYGASRHLKLPVNSVLFNGVGTYRPLVEPGYAANFKKKYRKDAQPLFLRNLIKVSERSLDRWEKDTKRTISRLIEDIEQNDFTRNAPDACTLWGGCEFQQLCKSSCTDPKDLISSMYNKEPWKGWQIEWEK